jgi:hypothetical protein
MKGVHKALEQFKAYSCKASKNNMKTVWVLKCDIKKFFASINHDTLIRILDREIRDKDIMWLLTQIISSFSSTEEGKGLPLGNLTSQLLVNIYMNEFDQHMKHKLKVKYYIRYADDFVVLNESKDYLLKLTSRIADFLEERLRLKLHPNKVFVKTLASGTDFLGWVHFPDHRVVRTTTKKRMLSGIRKCKGKEETIQSYLGLLKHGNGKKLICLLLKTTRNKIQTNENKDRRYL